MAKGQVMLILLLAVFVAIWASQDQLMARGDEDLVPSIQIQRIGNGSGSLRQAQCPGACTKRCSRTQYHKPCMFYCQKCCRKCLCVPPGYYGNKQVCPCYNNWKTKRGTPKCP